MQKNKHSMSNVINEHDQNLFLTSTNSCSHSQFYNKIAKKQLTPQNTRQRQIRLLRSTITTLIVQLKSAKNYPEIKHLFNEILYNIDTGSSSKKTIDKITAALKEQTNEIKLKRIKNQLRNLKKQQKKCSSVTGNQNRKRAVYYSNAKLKTNLPPKYGQQVISKTLSNEKDQEQLQKQRIYEQIWFRERQQKIQSLGQKHIQNRSQFIHRKILKAKQMNKRVKEVLQKNKLHQRQKISRHQYGLLFDPDQLVQIRKKRGRTMDAQTGKSFQIQDPTNEQQKVSSNEKLTNELEGSANMFELSKKKMKFASKQNECLTYMKNDLITFKSLKDLFNQKNQKLKYFKCITSKNYKPSVQFFLNQQKNKKMEKNSPFLNKENKEDFSGKFNTWSAKFELKKMQIQTKKLNFQHDREAKIIQEAIQKQRKIEKVMKNRKLASKTSKVSAQNSLNSSQIQSLSNLPQRSMFKKVTVSKKQLLDKERKIFVQIENKVDNKNQFLGERVNKVRQQLKKEEQIRQKHRQNCNQYINLTQNVSRMNSRSTSPKNRAVQDKNVGNKQLQNKKPSQQFVIKQHQLRNLKKHAKISFQSKLCNMSMNDLRKKIEQIQSKQSQAFSHQHSGYF